MSLFQIDTFSLPKRMISKTKVKILFKRNSNPLLSKRNRKLKNLERKETKKTRRNK